MSAPLSKKAEWFEKPRSASEQVPEFIQTHQRSFPRPHPPSDDWSLLTHSASAFTLTHHTTLDTGPCCCARRLSSPSAGSGTQKEISGCRGSPLRRQSVFRAGGRRTARQISHDTAREIYSQRHGSGSAAGVAQAGRCSNTAADLNADLASSAMVRPTPEEREKI